MPERRLTDHLQAAVRRSTQRLRHLLRLRPSPRLQPGVEGRLERYDPFASRYVEPRPVDVWLPPGFDARRRYPVLYLHDGQNLFTPEHAFSGVDWGVDEALARLIGAQAISPVIAVGIWNTAARIREYMPEKPLQGAAAEPFARRFAGEHGGMPCSDRYLAFLVRELKPFIDARYPTLPGRTHTFVLGSSMGGLVSLYALCEYPETFGGAACLSTSWTVGGAPMLAYLRDALPGPAGHRIYFDYGDEAHVEGYEALQQEADRILGSAGYVPEQTCLTRHFPGAAHAEQAWRERLHVPLTFLLAGLAESPA